MSPVSARSEATDPRSALRSGLAFLLAFGAGLAAAFSLSERLDPVFGPERAQFDRAVARAPTLEAVAIGNSHNHALDFDALNLAGEHLWDLGADYYDVLIRFRGVRPRLPHLQYVFLPVSPFVVDNAAFPDRQRSRVKSYVIADSYWPVANDWKLALSARVVPVTREDSWEGVARAAYRRVRGRAASRTPPGDGGAVPVAPASGIQDHAAWRVPHHKGLHEASQARNPSVCADAREALREIVVLAAPARVVLYTPPLAPSYRRLSGEELDCDLGRYSAALAQSLGHVSYFDDRSTPGFTDESGLFMDSDHLNPIGAKRYSQILRQRFSI